jgi:hypothetical protein
MVGLEVPSPERGVGNAVAAPTEVAGPPPTLSNLNRLAKWTLEADNSWPSGLIYVEGHAQVSSCPGNIGTNFGQTNASKDPNP